MTEAIKQLRLQSAAWGITLTEGQVSLLSRYAALLADYDLANVIGTRDRERIILDHLIDSLSCFTVEDLHRGNSLVDVGTGAGLPGIPLAISRSQLRVALLETTEKKVRFLHTVHEALGLRNVEVLHARAEDVGWKPTYREAFELATTRALAELPVVIEYCTPLVRTGGTILAMKGRLAEEELSKGVAASIELRLQLRAVKEVTYLAPFPKKERNIAIFDKVEETSHRYPRRTGLAKKQPLGV